MIGNNTLHMQRWARDALRHCKHEYQESSTAAQHQQCSALTCIAVCKGKHTTPERHRDGKTTHRDRDTTYRNRSSTYLAIHDDQRYSILCTDALKVQYQLSQHRPHSCKHPLIGHEFWCAAQRLPIANHELMQTVRVHQLLILPCCF